MRILIALSVVFLLASYSWAAPGGFQGGAPSAGAGGFHGPDADAKANVNTVFKAEVAADDTPVVLTGNIINRSLEDREHYIFRDSTGEIVVEIDDKLFMGRTITPEKTIRLYGEVDKDEGKRVKIDVKSFEIQ